MTIIAKIFAKIKKLQDISLKWKLLIPFLFFAFAGTTILATIGLTEPEQARIVWISTTLDLTEVAVSEVYRAEVEKREDLEIVGEAQELPFDSAGNLAFLETRVAHVA